MIPLQFLKSMPNPGRRRIPPLWLRAFWNRAYRERHRPLLGMVAIQPDAVAVFPFSLLISSYSARCCGFRSRDGVLDDLQRLFPTFEQTHLDRRALSGSRTKSRRSESRASRLRSGSAPLLGARWTPPSADSTTSSAAAGVEEALLVHDADRRLLFIARASSCRPCEGYTSPSWHRHAAVRPPLPDIMAIDTNPCILLAAPVVTFAILFTGVC
jgi:hypothetical protein